MEPNKSRPLTVGFIVPGLTISGGLNVIYQHALWLMDSQRWDVKIICESTDESAKNSWHEKASNLGYLNYAEAKNIHFDVLIATFWSTLYQLGRFKSDHFMYFVQSIESRFYDESDPFRKQLSETSYSFQIPVVTEATWIQTYLKQHYSTSAQLVKNGIQKDIFNKDKGQLEARTDGKLRVLVEGSLEAPFKNVAKTLELCKRSDADEVWLLTPSAHADDALADRVFKKVPLTQVARIMNSCDVIVKLSLVEGMFGPPLEMFHCGGTAIVYDVSGHDEYIVHGKNALVTSTHDEAKVVYYINKLKQDAILLHDLKHAAAITAENWPDWPTSSAQFEKAVLKVLNVQKDASDAIQAHVNAAYKHYSAALWKTHKPGWFKQQLMGTWWGDSLLFIAKKIRAALKPA